MSNVNIAVFVSSHGFGHAARSSAVMEALSKRIANVRYTIYTESPRWFFNESMTAPLTYRPLKADIGMAQNGPFVEDIPATIDALSRWIPFASNEVSALAEELTGSQCQLVICDISPLGLQVARTAGIPSLLIENFTWDWIYAEYQDRYPRIREYIRYLADVFNLADYHLKARPYCADGNVDAVVDPVSRLPKTGRAAIRKALNIPLDQKTVMVTMGGIPDRYGFLSQLGRRDDIVFILPGVEPGSVDGENLICLAHHSGYYHPDLLNAADAVVGKVGYSTISEVFAAGLPFGYILRETFRESPYLADFAKEYLPGIHLTTNEYQTGRWIERLDELLSQEKQNIDKPNGAEQVADFIVERSPLVASR